MRIATTLSIYKSYSQFESMNEFNLYINYKSSWKQPTYKRYNNMTSSVIEQWMKFGKHLQPNL